MKLSRLATSRMALWVIAGSLAGRALVAVLVALICVLPIPAARRSSMCSDVAAEVVKVELELLQVLKALAVHCGLSPVP